jgi:hypothetical protein
VGLGWAHSDCSLPVEGHWATVTQTLQLGFHDPSGMTMVVPELSIDAWTSWQVAVHTWADQAVVVVLHGTLNMLHDVRTIWFYVHHASGGPAKFWDWDRAL